MTWREVITGIFEARTHEPGLALNPAFFAAASAQDIAHMDVQLGAKLPHSLRSLLLETNGVMTMMKIDAGEWFEDIWLLWTVDEIVEQNLFYRAEAAKGEYERDFQKLVFFAGAGCDGILFGFPVMEDHVCKAGIVVWHPIEDELREIAPSLEAFLKGWLTSEISV